MQKNIKQFLITMAFLNLLVVSESMAYSIGFDIDNNKVATSNRDTGSTNPFDSYFGWDNNMRTRQAIGPMSKLAGGASSHMYSEFKVFTVGSDDRGNVDCDSGNVGTQNHCVCTQSVCGYTITETRSSYDRDVEIQPVDNDQVYCVAHLKEDFWGNVTWKINDGENTLGCRIPNSGVQGATIIIG